VPSIPDLARHLGLSPATVSTAPTGRRNGVRVSAETRELVWQTAREQGYPLERLRAGVRGTQQVAVLCPAGREAIYYGTALEVIRLLSQQECTVLVSLVEGEQTSYEEAMSLHSHNRVDAVVLVGSRTRPEYLPDKGVTFVMVGEPPAGMDVPRVGIDNREGGRMVGSYLRSLGHRRVGWVGLAPNAVSNELRLAGLRSEWEERGERFDEDWVLTLSRPDEDEVRPRLSRWLEGLRSRGQMVTVVAWYNDVLAAIGLEVLRSEGLRVPEDISVVGFGDAVFARWLDPPLTTVRQPFIEMGEAAAGLVGELCVDDPTRCARRVLPCELVPRASCAPPARNGSG